MNPDSPEASPEVDEVKVIDRDGVRWIEIDRPATKNGLTPEVNGEIIAALGEVPGPDRSLRVVVITGAGGSFSSGLDLKDSQRRGMGTTETIVANLDKYFHGLIRAVRAAPVPTIAAVDGVAAGFGCDLALACDLRLLSERARFSELFVRRGLIPDGGGTYTLPRIVGLGRALELMYTGDTVDADTALRIGLGNRLFTTHEFTDGVWAMARKLAKGPPLAYRLMKDAVYAGQHGDLDAALAREKAGQLQCLGSRDFIEGVTAFLQKRDPDFKGE